MENPSEITEIPVLYDVYMIAFYARVIASVSIAI